MQTIVQLPDDVALDKTAYGLDDVDAGRVVSSEVLAAEIEQG